MQAEEYESPKVSVISIEPDERLMDDVGFNGGRIIDEEYGYEAGFSGGEEAGITTGGQGQ